MKKVVINGYLYNISDRAYNEIIKYCEKGAKASPSEHEHGTAYQEYNNALERVRNTKKGIFIDGVYQYY